MRAHTPMGDIIGRVGHLVRQPPQRHKFPSVIIYTTTAQLSCGAAADFFSCISLYYFRVCIANNDFIIPGSGPDDAGSLSTV